MADESIAPIVRPRASNYAVSDGILAVLDPERTTDKNEIRIVFRHRHTRGRARRAARMEAILDQQAELLRVGEELIRESSRKLRDAAGPDALRQAYELYRGFFEAVDWTEPWLVAVLSLHAMLLLVAVATRKSETAQTCVFALCAFLVFIAERLNGLASAHWRAFSTQDYFDKEGVFTTTVFCVPLIAVLVVVLVNFLRLMASMMIQAKRAQLKQRARAEAKKER
jgi:hypothetical protein